MKDTLTHEIEIEGKEFVARSFLPQRTRDAAYRRNPLRTAPPLMVCLLKFILNHGGTVALKKHCDSLCRCNSVVQVI